MTLLGALALSYLTSVEQLILIWYLPAVAEELGSKGRGAEELFNFLHLTPHLSIKSQLLTEKSEKISKAYFPQPHITSWSFVQRFTWRYPFLKQQSAPDCAPV